jgi:hypothetical protein
MRAGYLRRAGRRLADGFTQLIAEQAARSRSANIGPAQPRLPHEEPQSHYVLFNIEAPAPAIAELSERADQRGVLRYHPQGRPARGSTSPVMQSRGSRQDRPRRDHDRYGEGRTAEPRENGEAIPERAIERPTGSAGRNRRQRNRRQGSAAESRRPRKRWKT